MSQIISVEKIEEGMILAEPIMNNYGQTLINSGVKLEEKHKKVLKMWNIKVVMVNSEEQEENEEMSEELRQMAIEKLNKRMNWQPRNPIELDLYAIGLLNTSKSKK
jgi:hypothetical protein